MCRKALSRQRLTGMDAHGPIMPDGVYLSDPNFSSAYRMHICAWCFAVHEHGSPSMPLLRQLCSRSWRRLRYALGRPSTAITSTRRIAACHSVVPQLFMLKSRNLHICCAADATVEVFDRPFVQVLQPLEEEHLNGYGLTNFRLVVLTRQAHQNVALELWMGQELMWSTPVVAADNGRIDTVGGIKMRLDTAGRVSFVLCATEANGPLWLRACETVRVRMLRLWVEPAVEVGAVPTTMRIGGNGHVGCSLPGQSAVKCQGGVLGVMSPCPVLLHAHCVVLRTAVVVCSMIGCRLEWDRIGRNSFRYSAPDTR